jgi:hypothetical protein
LSQALIGPLEEAAALQLSIVRTVTFDPMSDPHGRAATHNQLKLRLLSQLGSFCSFALCPSARMAALWPSLARH